MISVIFEFTFHRVVPQPYAGIRIFVITIHQQDHRLSVRNPTTRWIEWFLGIRVIIPKGELFSQLSMQDRYCLSAISSPLGKKWPFAVCENIAVFRIG